MKTIRPENTIALLSGHLQGNLQMFSGKKIPVAPKPGLQQLGSALALFLGVGLLAGFLHSRHNLLLRLVVLASTELLRGRGHEQRA